MDRRRTPNAADRAPKGFSPPLANERLHRVCQIAPDRAHKGLDTHGLSKQEALNQVEAQFARRKEIGVVLDPDSDCAGAELIGRTDNMPAQRPLRAIVGATSHQFCLNLDFDERKIPQSQERGPLAAESVNRNGKLAQSGLFGEVARRRKIARDVAAVDLENKSCESGIVRQLTAEVVERLWIFDEIGRLIDRSRGRCSAKK